MSKENQRIMITKRLLKEALIEILKGKPIKKVSVTELCERAEINRSTFYAHYNIPQDVLTEIKRDFATQIVEALRLLEQDAAPKDQLVRICEFIAANAELEKVILVNSTDDEVTEAALGNMFDTWDIADSFIRDKDMDKYTRRLVNIFCYQGIFRVIREWIIREIPKSPIEVAEILSDILFS